MSASKSVYISPHVPNISKNIYSDRKRKLGKRTDFLFRNSKHFSQFTSSSYLQQLSLSVTLSHLFSSTLSLVQHSWPATKPIASTSFQGHTITTTSRALLHEYIEERFPATLFHDWIPKDMRKRRKKLEMGKWKERRGGCRYKVCLQYSAARMQHKIRIGKMPNKGNNSHFYVCMCLEHGLKYEETLWKMSEGQTVWK